MHFVFCVIAINMKSILKVHKEACSGELEGELSGSCNLSGIDVIIL